MQSYTLVLLAAFVAMAMAEGQFYVPRAYYTIDAEGHASAPVPLRRLRRSINPYPYLSRGANANANAEANANAWGNGEANAHATANANAASNGGGWDDFGAPPSGAYGASNPTLLRH